MILRSFLYLDNSTVDDYLSTLEGYVATGTVEETEISKSKKSGSVGISVVKGELGGEKELASKKSFTITDAAKFQILYEKMEKNDLIQYLDAFDEKIWRQIKRSEILEIPCQIRLPEFLKFIKGLNDVAPVMNLLSSVESDSIDSVKMKQTVDIISLLTMLTDSKSVPLKLTPISTDGYSFATKLNTDFLKKELSELEGESTILAKVQRIIPKGHKEETFNILPEIFFQTKFVTKQQKLDFLKKMGQLKVNEVIKGPAMLLTPIAIYR